MQSFYDRICNKSKSATNGSYKIINDFESSSEKQCSKLDSKNEKIYSTLLSQAEKAHAAIKHSGLSMNLEVPIPPRPSNRDRYLLWKKRNISKKVIEQTEAVLFLKETGYNYNEHYEAYQAVDLATEIKKQNGDKLEYKDSSKNFDNVYNKHDQNILRRRSMYRLSQYYEDNEHTEQCEDNKIYTNNDTNEANNNSLNQSACNCDHNQSYEQLQPIKNSDRIINNNFFIKDQTRVKLRNNSMPNNIKNSTKNNNNSNNNDNNNHNKFRNSHHLYSMSQLENIEQLTNIKPSAPPASTNHGVITFSKHAL